MVARLLAEREIGGRGEAPRSSPRELHDHFAYLDPVKLETILARQTLPPELEGLAEAMGRRGVKGEQEGLVL